MRNLILMINTLIYLVAIGVVIFKFAPSNDEFGKNLEKGLILCAVVFVTTAPGNLYLKENR